MPNCMLQLYNFPIWEIFQTSKFSDFLYCCYSLPTSKFPGTCVDFALPKEKNISGNAVCRIQQYEVATCTLTPCSYMARQYFQLIPGPVYNIFSAP